MCTVSVKVDKDPELLLKPSEIVDDGGEAIDLETAREMLHETVHDVYAMPDRDMTPEELYNAISDEIDYIYAKGWHEVHHQATGIA